MKSWQESINRRKFLSWEEDYRSGTPLDEVIENHRYYQEGLLFGMGTYTTEQATKDINEWLAIRTTPEFLTQYEELLAYKESQRPIWEEEARKREQRAKEHTAWLENLKQTDPGAYDHYIYTNRDPFDPPEFS